jgi:uncharacterized membrane protein YfcA
MPEQNLLFFVLLFVVAFLYASVGHGGASGYLALMALFSLSPEIMRPSALFLNIFVSLIAFVQYYRKVPFRWRLFLLLTVLSVPAAFIGGMISLDPGLYKKILGVFLIVPILRFAGLLPGSSTAAKEVNTLAALGIGAVIGFLSGLIGIGGGILLSPVLLLLGWAAMKETAAISALFITVNSVAGLLGNASSGFHLDPQILWLAGVAVAGGTSGSYLGANYFSSILLKRILAFVLVIAALKLVFT